MTKYSHNRNYLLKLIDLNKHNSKLLDYSILSDFAKLHF